MTIAQLAVEEAAAIAEEGVVVAELIAVISQGQQGAAAFKPPIGRLEMLIGNAGRIEPELQQQRVVAEAQGGAGKAGGLHHIPVGLAQSLQRRLKWERQQRVGGKHNGRHGAGNRTQGPSAGVNNSRMARP